MTSILEEEEVYLSGDLAAKETSGLIVELHHRFTPKPLISDAHSTAVVHIGFRCDEIATGKKNRRAWRQPALKVYLPNERSA